MVLREFSNFKMAVEENESNTIYIEESKIHLFNNVNIQDIDALCNRINIIEKKDMPLITMIEITNVCNFSCQFCYIANCNNEKKFISLDKFKQLVDQLVAEGCILLKITGGESLLHKNFKEMYLYAKNRGLIVEIYSNGSLINKDYIELFKDYPPYRIEVSLYGFDDKLFQNITRNNKPGLSSTITDNILSLKENGIKVVCKSTINTLTVDEINTMSNWCKQNDISFYYSVDMIDSYDGNDLSRFNISDTQKIDFNIAKLHNTDLVFVCKPKEGFSCGAIKRGCYINYNLDLFPCNSFVGNNDFCVNITDIDCFKYYYEKLAKKTNQYVGMKLCNGCDAYVVCKECIATYLSGKQKKCDYYQKLKYHYDMKKNNI